MFVSFGFKSQMQRHVFHFFIMPPPRRRRNIILLPLLLVLLFMTRYYSGGPRYTGSATTSAVARKAAAATTIQGRISVISCGRLGNQLVQYAVLIAAAEKTGYQPVFINDRHSLLKAIFPRLSRFETVSWSGFTSAAASFISVKAGELLEREEFGFSEYESVQVEFPCVTNYAHFHAYKPAILRYLQFRPDVERMTRSYFEGLIANSRDEVTFVGVHIRRTDYISYLNNSLRASPLERDWYDRAMAEMRRLILDSASVPRIYFIIISDEPEWVQRRFGGRKDIFLPRHQEKGLSWAMQAALDLSILSRCNHSIIDYGSFGFWSAYLRRDRGWTLVADKFLPDGQEPSIVRKAVRNCRMKGWIPFA